MPCLCIRASDGLLADVLPTRPVGIAVRLPVFYFLIVPEVLLLPDRSEGRVYVDPGQLTRGQRTQIERTDEAPASSILVSSSPFNDAGFDLSSRKAEFDALSERVAAYKSLYGGPLREVDIPLRKAVGQRSAKRREKLQKQSDAIRANLASEIARKEDILHAKTQAYEEAKGLRVAQVRRIRG